MEVDRDFFVDFHDRPGGPARAHRCASRRRLHDGDLPVILGHDGFGEGNLLGSLAAGGTTAATGSSSSAGRSEAAPEVAEPQVDDSVRSRRPER